MVMQPDRDVSDPQALESFQREVARLVEVRNANVIALFGVILRPPCLYLIEERMARTLSALLSNSAEARELPVKRVSVALSLEDPSQGLPTIRGGM
jgi:hypothetical protein